MAEIYAHFHGRTNTLVREFNTVTPQIPMYEVTCLPLHRSGRLLLVVRFVHLWGEFCRTLITRSALGNVRTVSNSVLPAAPGISCSSDVSNIARLESNNRPPPWHNSGYSIRVAQRLNVANYSTIGQSIGAVSPIRELIDIRNFVVHPNQRTLVAFQSVALSYGVSTRQPLDVLSLTQPGGQNLLTTWIFRFQTIAAAAVK